MLPDYPESKKKLRERLTRPISRVHKLGLFAETDSRQIFEGSKIGIIREDGSKEIVKLLHLKSSALHIDLKDYENITIADIAQKLLALARELHLKQSKAFFNQIHQTLDAAGQTMDFQGRPLTPELFLELFQKMQIEFGDDGKPRMPAIVAGEETIKILQDMMKQSEGNLAIQSKFDEIMDQKRRAWLDRESSRKLVG